MNNDDLAKRFEQRIKMAVGDLRNGLLTEGIEVTLKVDRNGSAVTVTVVGKELKAEPVVAKPVRSNTTTPAIIIGDDDDDDDDDEGDLD